MKSHNCKHMQTHATTTTIFVFLKAGWHCWSTCPRTRGVEISLAKESKLGRIKWQLLCPLVRVPFVSFMYHSCIIHVSFMYHSCMFQYISLIKHYQFLIWLICLLSSRALGMLLALNWSKDPGKFQGRATLDPPVPSCTCSATKSVSQPRCRLGRRLLRDWRRSAGLPGLRCRSANPANSDLSISSVSGVGQETSWIQGSWPIGWDYLRLLDTTRGCLIRAPALACH